MRVPEKCLICGQGDWHGGHEVPGKLMKPGLRVFYSCGASLSYKVISEGIYHLLTKNCCRDKGDCNKA